MSIRDERIKKVNHGNRDKEGFFNIGEMGKTNHVIGVKYLGKHIYRENEVHVVQLRDSTGGYCFYKVRNELVEQYSNDSTYSGEIGSQIEQLAYIELVINPSNEVETKDFVIMPTFEL